MCRSIKTLRNAEVPATEEEIRAAARSKGRMTVRRNMGSIPVLQSLDRNFSGIGERVAQFYQSIFACFCILIGF